MARTEVTGRQIKDKSVSLADDVVDLLPVTSGGTGVATLPSGGLLLGNGTGAVQTVFPGTAGNVLTSSSGAWVSAAPLIINDVEVLGDTLQFYSGTEPVGDPVTLALTVIDGGTPATAVTASQTAFIEGGTP